MVVTKGLKLDGYGDRAAPGQFVETGEFCRWIGQPHSSEVDATRDLNGEVMNRTIICGLRDGSQIYHQSHHWNSKSSRLIPRIV